MSSFLRRTLRKHQDSSIPIDQLVQLAANHIRTSRRIAILTGAGISAESGVPTFRGHDGLWQKFRPEELANFEAFIQNPELVRTWYAHRRRLVESVKPNQGHYALVEIESRVPRCTIITQNVDNLHQQAGSQNVIELHGNIFKNYCLECGKRHDLDGGLNNETTRCACGGLIRPDVVWFGEPLPVEQYSKAEDACKACDLMMTIGTSGAVYPAAGLPFLARENGSFLIEINPQRTEISHIMDVIIPQNAGIALPKIVDALRK